ncbi:16S rRNA (cytosine(1402)-N(4))-methyltransferase RsmH [Candidatus Berkelbacteria bacterium]|nr:16S rRNA (cytosine(1402)-N(4))-methyltransferase RsmH [Candidatus Berkelbacteria bacterium]
MEELSKHKSILVSEIINFLEIKKDGNYLDGTFGGGGHSRAILERLGPKGHLYALDRDPTAIRFAKTLKSKNFHFFPLSYLEVEDLEKQFDGAILDLGFSTDQLYSSGRGFSHTKTDELLDLRYDANGGQSAWQFLNQASVSQIEKVFREYSEDRYAKHLASKITASRREKAIKTVGDFVEIIGTSEPAVLSRLFQGLRIQVNDELDHLKFGLREIKKCLKVGGVLAVISFHSIEDRIVKNFMKEQMKVVTKKPVTPTLQEIQVNPSSRSAKLRVSINL